MDDTTARLRLSIYEWFRDRGRAPSPIELAAQAGLTPTETWDLLRDLQDTWDAIVLIPGSQYLWMAEPFSALPTNHLVVSGDRSWWGNCVWDALGVLGVLGIDGEVRTACPSSGTPLTLAVEAGALAPTDAVVHFAVPAGRWWERVGFT